MKLDINPIAPSDEPRSTGPSPNDIQQLQRPFKRIKVLIIIPTLDRGGAEMDLARVLPWMDNDKFELLIFTFLARGALAQQLVAAGIEVVGPLVAGETRWFREFKRTVLGLIAIITPRLVRYVAARFWPRCRIRLSQLVSRSIGCLKQLTRYVPAPVLRVFRNGLAWSTYLLVGVSLAPFIHARRVDVIHTVLPNSYVVGSVANYMFNHRPLIMSRVSMNWYQRRDPFYRFVERKLLHRKVDVAVCNCKEISRELQEEGVKETKLRLINNGIDVFEFSRQMTSRPNARDRLGIPKGAVVFSVVANLYEYKGHTDILNALYQARDKLPEWILLIVGRDYNGFQSELERLCRELGISQRVLFLGERSDVPIILSAADIHISGSHTEGLPNNIIEAMCARLPIIATRVGGSEELVIHRETGLLVPPRDPVAMGRALLQLATDGGLRERMGEAGLKVIISNFSIDRTAAAFEKLYAEVAVGHRSFRPEKSGTGYLAWTGRIARSLSSHAKHFAGRVVGLVLHFKSNVATFHSYIAEIRGLPRLSLRNLFVRRRERLQLDVPFDFAFHDLSIVRQTSYRPDSSRVLMVVPTFGRGGAERMMLATAADLASRGYQVRLLALRELLPNEPDILNEIAQHGLDHRAWRGAGLSFWEWWRRFNNKSLRPYANKLPTWHYNWAAEIAVTIQDFRPAVVHAWLDQPILIAGAVSCLLGVPRFIGNQQVAVNEEIHALFDPYVAGYRALAHHPNVTLTNCGAATAKEYERWLDLPSQSIKVIPNVFWPELPGQPSPQEVDAYRRELGLPAKCPVVGTVMRLTAVKDPRLWLATAAEISRMRPDVRFVMAGHGELASATSNWVRELGLSDKVILAGGVADVRLIYAISDVVMLTSRSEASPLVFIEAQSAGRPVVGPDVGAIRETVVDGVTARIVLDRSPSAFAEVVLEILSDPDWRDRAATSGPVFISEKFDRVRIIESTLALYKGSGQSGLGAHNVVS